MSTGIVISLVLSPLIEYLYARVSRVKSRLRAHSVIVAVFIIGWTRFSSSARAFPHHARTNLTLLHTKTINRVSHRVLPFAVLKLGNARVWRRAIARTSYSRKSIAHASFLWYSSRSEEAVITYTRWTNEITSWYGTSNTITRHYLRAYIRPRLNRAPAPFKLLRQQFLLN